MSSSVGVFVFYVCLAGKLHMHYTVIQVTSDVTDRLDLKFLGKNLLLC